MNDPIGGDDDARVCALAHGTMIEEESLHSERNLRVHLHACVCQLMGGNMQSGEQCVCFEVFPPL